MPTTSMTTVTMLKCPFCSRVVKNLHFHLNKSCPSAPSHRPSKKSNKNKRKLPALNPKPSRYDPIRKRTDTTAIESSLSKDTHDAPKNIVSDQLNLVPSLRNQAKNAIFVPSQSDPNPEPEVLDDIAFDVPDDLLNEKLSSTHFDDSNSDENIDLHPESNLSEDLLKFIDVTRPDPFDPNSIDEDKIPFIGKTHSFIGKLPDHLLAQIDLLRILSRSGCSLAIYDRIIQWLLHYSKKDKKRNIWTECEIMTRKPLITELKKIFETKKHEPIPKQVVFAYDGRSATIPTFSFLTEAMSLLHDPTTMSPDNIIPGYDIYSGKTGELFWDDSKSSYTPNDPHRKMGEITTSLTFQRSVQRFCSKPHHMPVPLVFFYDKANLDRNGGLALSPLIFTFGFFKSKRRRRSKFWRPLAYVPNLDIGQGRSSSKNAFVKQQEHHQVLAVVFDELQKVSQDGGVKTKIGNRTVVLKFFIQFIIGDTAGHNDLCLQYQTNAEQPCRTCHCTRERLSAFDSNTCFPKSMNDIVMSAGQETVLRGMSLRHGVSNSMYNLPMSDRTRGIFGCTPWETLHVFDQGLIQYVMESFHDIFGEKSSGKKKQRTIQ